MSALGFASWALRRKIGTLVLLAATLPLLVTLSLSHRTMERSSRDNAVQLLTARAEQFVAEIDGFHEVYLRRAERLAGAPLAIAQLRGEETPDPATLLEGFRTGDEAVRDVALLTPGGRVVAATSATLEVSRTLRTEALKGQAAVSDLSLAPPVEGSVPQVQYAAPVRDGAGEILGIAVLVVNVESLWSLVESADRIVGEGSHASLLDRHGIRIGHSAGRDFLFHPIAPLGPSVVDPLVAQERYGPDTEELLETVRRIEGVDPEQVLGTDTVLRLHTPANEGWNLCKSKPLALAAWTFLECVPEETLSGPALAASTRTSVLSGFLVVGSLVGGLVMAGWLVRPLDELVHAAGRLERGDLTARVGLDGRGDEMGALAKAFNDMAAALGVSREDLERQIVARTVDIQHARDALARQNRVLEEQSGELTRRRDQALAYGRALAALGGPRRLESVLEDALRVIAEATSAVVVVCYRVSDRGALTPLATYGGAGLPAAGDALGGLAQEAVRTNRAVFVECLPPDVDFRFDAALAAGRPTCLGLVPLLVGERVVGLVALGALRPLDPPNVELLSDLAVPLALTIARHDLADLRDTMAEELARQNEELTVQAAELQAQSEELHAQQRELETRNNQVEATNHFKSEFIANMSHELRTPLNSVIGFTELVLGETGSSLEERQQRYLEHVRASGRHLLSLINDILDLARIEAGRLSLSIGAVDPAVAVSEAVAIVASAASAKQITVREAESADGRVRADPDKLRQVLINLLSNAVKFSPNGSGIEIGCRREGSAIRFWVRDEGPGIDEGLRDKLFEPFVQGETPLVKRHEGTGLGLAISRKLVEHMGGRIELVSGPGEAAHFVVHLPLAVPGIEPVAQGGQIPPTPTALFLEKPVERARLVEQVSKLAPAADGHMPAVLVVDDDPAVGTLLSATLEPAGYAVSAAVTAAEGLERARRDVPDVLIVDLDLPDLSGLELILLLRTDARTRSCPIVVLTAMSVSSEERERLEAEVQALAEKGHVTSNDMLSTLRDAVRSSSARPSRGRGRILVVEDNDLNIELCRVLLEREGYEVLQARDGDEGLDLARREVPDVILMDLAMPKRDGFSTMAALRRDERTAAIPVLAVTARALSHERQRAEAAGFVGWIPKPIDGDVLLGTIAELLAPGR